MTSTQVQTAVEASTDALKVFIVEDNQMLLTALSVFLNERFGSSLSISTFATGEQAIDQIDRTTQIIILDYFLDTMEKDAANGLEIMKRIKKRYPNVHVIMLSSQERYGLAMQTIQSGAEHYIIKDDAAFEKVAAIIDEFI